MKRLRKERRNEWTNLLHSTKQISFLVENRKISMQYGLNENKWNKEKFKKVEKETLSEISYFK